MLELEVEMDGKVKKPDNLLSCAGLFSEASVTKKPMVNSFQDASKRGSCRNVSLSVRKIDVKLLVMKLSECFDRRQALDSSKQVLAKQAGMVGDGVTPATSWKNIYILVHLYFKCEDETHHTGR
jgi:hypothetical protein